MKTEIPLLPAIIAAVIYACGLVMLSLQVIQWLSLVLIEASEFAEGLEVLL